MGLYDAFVIGCARLYYDRITRIGAKPSNRRGGILYVGLHRNGAIDGFVYKSVLPRATFMISTQLREHPLGRLFFRGIEVVRPKDEGDRKQNIQAMEACMDLLGRCGEVFIFPEGTSTLGPRHLPFKSGAAHLWLQALASKIDIQVIPVGIHYERPWAFRSRVEVVVGPEIKLPDLISSGEFGKLRTARRAIEQGLEAVGVNVSSSEEQENLHRLAYAATLGTRYSYFDVMKKMEIQIPARLLVGWQGIQRKIIEKRLWIHQGIPLFPMGTPWTYGLMFCLLAPWTVLSGILNAPALAAGYLAGRRWADASNVIALWRCLVGIPCFGIWMIILAGVSSYLHHLVLFWIYVAVTIIGILSYYRVKKVAVALGNGFRHPELKPMLFAFHEEILGAMAHS